MNTHDVRTRFAYNRWANRRLLFAAMGLGPDDLTRDLKASFGSLKGTLLHILWGERRWIRFWQDGSFIPELTPEDFPDLPAVEADWAALEEEQQSFGEQLTEESLAAVHTVRDRCGNSATIVAAAALIIAR